MSSFPSQQIDRLLPEACAWAAEQEGVIQRTGVPLTEAQMADARQIGVAHPERVRLLRVPAIPTPNQNGELVVLVHMMGLILTWSRALSLRYGIFICENWWGERRAVVHELVHTRQYEQLGGLEEFLNTYIRECNDFGYDNAPLELEARKIENQMCGP